MADWRCLLALCLALPLRRGKTEMDVQRLKNKGLKRGAPCLQLLRCCCLQAGVRAGILEWAVAPCGHPLAQTARKFKHRELCRISKLPCPVHSQGGETGDEHTRPDGDPDWKSSGGPECHCWLWGHHDECPLRTRWGGREIRSVPFQKVTFLSEDSKRSWVGNFSAESPPLSCPLSSLLMHLEKVCGWRGFSASPWLPPAGALDPSQNRKIPANHVGFNGPALTATQGPISLEKRNKPVFIPSLFMKFQQGKSLPSSFVVFQNRSPGDQTFLFIPETPSEGQELVGQCKATAVWQGSVTLIPLCCLAWLTLTPVSITAWHRATPKGCAHVCFLSCKALDRANIQVTGEPQRGSCPTNIAKSSPLLRKWHQYVWKMNCTQPADSSLVAAGHFSHKGAQCFPVEINWGFGLWKLAVLLWAMPAGNPTEWKHLESQTFLSEL